MTTTTKNPGEIKEIINQPIAEMEGNKKCIEHHRQAAAHHQEAAKNHLEAAKYHETGNPEQAAACTIKANGHHCMAGEHQAENSKFHALRG